MLFVYILSLVIGGGLIALSLLGSFGGHGADADVGAGDGIDGGVSGDGGTDGIDHAGDHGDGGFHEHLWLPFFSIRFWTYFAFVFGASGLLLSLFRASAEPLTLILSMGAAVGMGLLVAYLMRWIRSNEADGSARLDDVLGRVGRVTVPIREGQTGRIRVNVKGDEIDYLALADQSGTFDEGEEVIVVGVEGNQARVVPKSELYKELE
ncbi:MAG: NfeD family protein [Fimbriimonadaceae bacterium]